MATTERQRQRRPSPFARRPITDPTNPDIARTRERAAVDAVDPALDPMLDPVGRPAPPPPAGDWRAAVATASGLNLLAGIWLIIAPFVLGYRSGDPIWNDVVFGAIVAVVALARVAGAYRASELSWINALIGAWIFASAFWLDSSGRAAANDIILGIVVFVLAIASATASEDAAARSWYRR